MEFAVRRQYLDDEELETLLELAERATPRPWYVQNLDDDSAMSLTAISIKPSTGYVLRWPMFDGGEMVAATLVQQPRYVSIDDGKWHENANYIVAAANLLPTLVLEIQDRRKWGLTRYELVRVHLGSSPDEKELLLWMYILSTYHIQLRSPDFKLIEALPTRKAAQLIASLWPDPSDAVKASHRYWQEKYAEEIRFRKLTEAPVELRDKIEELTGRLKSDRRVKRLLQVHEDER